MTIELRIDENGTTGASISVLINDRFCGRLTMSHDLAKAFIQVVQNGTGSGTIDGFKVTGELYDPCGEPPPNAEKRRCRR